MLHSHIYVRSAIVDPELRLNKVTIGDKGKEKDRHAVSFAWALRARSTKSAS